MTGTCKAIVRGCLILLSLLPRPVFSDGLSEQGKAVFLVVADTSPDEENLERIAGLLCERLSKIEGFSVTRWRVYDSGAARAREGRESETRGCTWVVLLSKTCAPGFIRARCVMRPSGMKIMDRRIPAGEKKTEQAVEIIVKRVSSRVMHAPTSGKKYRLGILDIENKGMHPAGGEIEDMLKEALFKHLSEYPAVAVLERENLHYVAPDGAASLWSANGLLECGYMMGPRGKHIRIEVTLTNFPGRIYSAEGATGELDSLVAEICTGIAGDIVETDAEARLSRSAEAKIFFEKYYAHRRPKNFKLLSWLDAAYVLDPSNAKCAEWFMRELGKVLRASFYRAGWIRRDRAAARFMDIAERHLADEANPILFMDIDDVH